MSIPKNLGWDAGKALEPIGTNTGVYEDLNATPNAIVVMSKLGDPILVMSNDGFGRVYGKILAELAEREMRPAETRGSIAD